jgi:integrase/recombinase XerD
MLVISDLYPAIERDYKIEKKRTLRNVTTCWQKHLSSFFAAQPVTPFKPSRVKAYILQRQTEGAQNSTINRELAVLKRMAALAVEEYEEEIDDEKAIASLMRWSRIKSLDESDNIREQTFPNELYDAFALETAREGLWFRTMFELAYARGWRPGSLRKLQVKNIDLVRRTIRLTGRQTKNKRPCEIGMTDKEFDLLAQCVARKGPEDYVLTRERDFYGRPPRNGGRIVDYREAWERVCKRVGVKAGRDGLIFYDLKRAGITNMIDTGLDVKDAMKVTGQLTESAFRRYQQVSTEKLHEVARKIERAHRERQRKAHFRQAELFGLEAGRKPS